MLEFKVTRQDKLIRDWFQHKIMQFPKSGTGKVSWESTSSLYTCFMARLLNLLKMLNSITKPCSVKGSRESALFDQLRVSLHMVMLENGILHS